MNQSIEMPLAEKLKQLKVIPVINPPSVDTGLRLAEILTRNELPVAEITFRTDCAVDTIRQIHLQFPEILLLAGTVLSPQQADEALAAGASALVSPGLTSQLALYCQENNTPFIPGVCTPSEIQAALELGLDHLKFFPAALTGGLTMLSLFNSVYPQVQFMPTGGITQENIQEYLALNNVFCCGGTWLSPKDMMANGRWEEIEERISLAAQNA